MFLLRNGPKNLIVKWAMDKEQARRRNQEAMRFSAVPFRELQSSIIQVSPWCVTRAWSHEIISKSSATLLSGFLPIVMMDPSTVFAVVDGCRLTGQGIETFGPSNTVSASETSTGECACNR